jgi:CheY-like chemotaxis protein
MTMPAVTRATSSSQSPQQSSHWLVRAAERANLPAADSIAIARGASPTVVWEAVCRTVGLPVEALVERIAAALRMKSADLAAAVARTRRLVPERLARKYAVFPIGESDRAIVIATSDPFDLDAEQALAFAAGRRVTFALASPQSIDEAISAGYSPDRAVGCARCANTSMTALQEIDRVFGDSSATTSNDPAAQVPEAAKTAFPRILVVDDDNVQLALSRAVLERAGFEVVTAGDGNEGFSHAAAGGFDLMVTDLHMPNLDGSGLVRRVRGHVDTASLPIIVVTGSDDCEDEVAIMNAGADDYMRKPVEPLRLTARVNAALRRAGVL